MDFIGKKSMMSIAAMGMAVLLSMALNPAKAGEVSEIEEVVTDEIEEVSEAEEPIEKMGVIDSVIVKTAERAISQEEIEKIVGKSVKVTVSDTDGQDEEPSGTDTKVATEEAVVTLFIPETVMEAVVVTEDPVAETDDILTATITTPAGIVGTAASYVVPQEELEEEEEERKEEKTKKKEKEKDEDTASGQDVDPATDTPDPTLDTEVDPMPGTEQGYLDGYQGYPVYPGGYYYPMEVVDETYYPEKEEYPHLEGNGIVAYEEEEGVGVESVPSIITDEGSAETGTAIQTETDGAVEMVIEIEPLEYQSPLRTDTER